MMWTNYLAAMFLSLTILVNFQQCGGNLANAQSETNKKMISGNFSAQTAKSPGFIKLEINSDGTALLLNVSTIHLPPIELERLPTKISRTKEGAFCLAEKPKTIEQCLVSADEQSIVVRFVPDGTELKLEKTDK